MMKKLVYFLTVALAGTFAFASCTKESNEKDPEVPIKSISVKCGDETVAGVVDDNAQKVTFTFNNAETYSNVDISIEVNKGWTLTYPTVLTGVDLQSTPVLRFTSPSNASVRYTIAFSSNAFPIVDPSKIQIEGLKAGENVSVDNGSKTISVKYDQDVIDYNNVKLIFNEGALQTGTQVPEDTDYDFSDGIEQEIIFKLGGQDRVYKVRLDVTAYSGKSMSEMGFTDITANFVDAGQYPFVHVYSADQFLGIPVYNVNSFWAPSNPRSWEYGEELAEGEHYRYSNDAFSFPGDWKEDRPTMNGFGKIVIVTLDQESVKGDITANIDTSKHFSDYNNLVVVTGCKHMNSIDYMVYDNGVMANNPTGDHAVLWRNSVGFNSDGKMSFSVATYKNDKFYSVPKRSDWITEGDAFASEVQQVADAADKQWDVTDASWVYGWAIRDGKALKVTDIIKNDATQYCSDQGVLGMGWGGFYMKRIVIGRTYDNKIAIMVSGGGQDLWDGSKDNAPSTDWPDRWGGIAIGYSTAQMVWIANQLGWRDAALLTSSDDEKPESLPNVKVNGTTVISQADATYQPERYANNGATLTASYFITFDAK